MGTLSWTAGDLPDQSGRTVVVTGGNSGIGFEGTKLFARHGAHVVMACRDLDRASAAADDVRAAINDPSLSVHDLDLADLASVRSFVDTVTRTHDELHVLCNNAGIMAIPRRETADGSFDLAD